MPRGPRIAALTDAPVVVEILAEAFADDPLWVWAFPDKALRSEHLSRFLSFAVAGGLRYSGVWLTPGNAATSVWIPPGGSEFSTEQQQEFEPLLTKLLGDQAGRLIGLFASLTAVHPFELPHYFLSMLGTAPARRGFGHGLSLLVENLRRVDEEHMPAYLEASNPANVPLYGRYGFEVYASVQAPQGGPEVFTMWREPASGRPNGPPKH